MYWVMVRVVTERWLCLWGLGISNHQYLYPYFPVTLIRISQGQVRGGGGVVCGQVPIDLMMTTTMMTTTMMTTPFLVKVTGR
jgi:hypothetical protein